jgi:hypothetical protein
MKEVVEAGDPPRAPLSNTAPSLATYADSSVVTFTNDAWSDAELLIGYSGLR